MLYVEKKYRTLFESATVSDTGKDSKQFMEMIYKISESDVNDEIRQSVTQRCKWFLEKLFDSNDELVELPNNCNVEIKTDNGLKVFVDKNEVDGATKGLVTALVSISNLANQSCDRKSVDDKIIINSSKIMYDEFREELASKTYPIDMDILKQLKCKNGPLATLLMGLIGLILISDKFDKYEMMLALIGVRVLKNPKTCMKYLVTLLSKINVGFDKDVLIKDLRQNYL